MRPPDIPDDEHERLATLRGLRILDTAPEEKFDRYTRIVRRLFQVPIALVSLVDADRQWFKSRQGLDASETSREVSFCAHAIHDVEVMVVEDTATDERFSDNPLVTGDPRIRFYAGCPLPSGCGTALGTLCVIDTRPRVFTAEDLECLTEFGRMVAEDLVTTQLVTTDPLTGLSNRLGFTALSERLLQHANGAGLPFSLLFFDLDRFKQINDTLGHAVGDQALRAMAECLRHSFRSSDIIGRLSGDEFCVALMGASATEALGALRRLDESIAAHNSRGAPFQLRYSVGVASVEASHGARLCDLLSVADAAMYNHKRRLIRDQTPTRLLPARR